MNDPDLSHQWISDLDAETSLAIIALVDCATGDEGTLGYAESMSAVEAELFVGGLRKRIAAGESHVLLGRIGGLPAFLAVLTLNGMSNCRHRAELSKGVVHPNYRGRHFVHYGFRELVRRAEQLGVEQFVLDVRENSRAHLLWQRFGFASFGVLEDYARVRGASHRGHFMVQQVSSLRARLWAGISVSTEKKDSINA